MLITIDAGHNCKPDTGAKKYRFEDELTKEVTLLIKNKLQVLGHTVIDVTPYGSNFNSVIGSLGNRVQQANRYKADLHICNHFNAGGGTGVEVYISSRGGQAEKYAIKICEEISKSLDVKNRGVKEENLYIPKYTNSPCILIEYLFVDNESDMNKYDATKISDAVIKAITGKVVEVSKPSISTPIKEPINQVKPTDIKVNATISNDFLYVRDINRNKINGRVDIGDNVEVLDVLYSKQLVLMKYPIANGYRTEYVNNATNCIKYKYKNEYKNGSTSENVYEDPQLKRKIGSLNPYEKATPLHRKNGNLCVAYCTNKGENTKSGYVKYNGGFNKF